MRRAAAPPPAPDAAARSRIADAIRRHLPVQPVRSVPEIRLHQATSGSGLARHGLADDETAPYWAFCWSGGLALARHFLDRPESVAGCRLLDLGAGSGLVGIAAARAGAAAVVAAEADVRALVAIGLNARLNHVRIAAAGGDALDRDPPPVVDLVAVGDLFYDGVLAARVCAFLDRCRDRGLRVLVGDPGRRHLPVDRLRQVAEYRVAEYGAERPAGVFLYGS